MRFLPSYLVLALATWLALPFSLVAQEDDAALPMADPQPAAQGGEALKELEPAREVRQYRMNFDEFQVPPEEARNLLAGREWTALTEIDPILDAARRQEILELIKEAREKHGITLMVVTVKAQNVREYPSTIQALLREKLALVEGGVVVCTEVAGTHMTAYTTLLETRLGRRALADVDREAFKIANLAVGPNERGLSLVRGVLDGLRTRMEALKAGGDGDSVAEALFATSDVILTDEQAAARKRPVPAAETARPATGAPQERDATTLNQPVDPRGPAPASPRAQVKQPESPGFLVPFIAGMGALLLLIAAGLVTRLAVGGLRRRRRRSSAQYPESGVTSTRRDAVEKAPAAEGEAPVPAVAAPAFAPITPRQFDNRKSRRRTGVARREELQESVDGLENLLQTNRAKPLNEPFDVDAELDRLTLQEIQMHFRSLYKTVPPSSRPGLSESLEKLLDELRDEGKY
jgi:hypothetical protein